MCKGHIALSLIFAPARTIATTTLSLMRRRKPNSGKAKKEHLQAHRALKANNASLLVNPPADRGAQTVVIAGANQEQQQQQQRERARQPQRAIHDGRNPTSSARAALESRFIKLAPAVLEHYKTQLAKRPFDRPVDASKAILDDQQLGNLSHRPALVCPKRPKWKYYMLKKEVEKVRRLLTCSETVQGPPEAVALANLVVIERAGHV